MDRSVVETWVARYERVWRTPGTDALREIFSDDVRYLPSPWSRPVIGVAALASFWESERDGADEDFSMSSDVVALEGRRAVVRVSVEYAGPTRGRWRDLWVIELADDGRCTAFEEWPFAARHPDSD